MTGVAAQEADVVLRHQLPPPCVVGRLENTHAAVVDNPHDAAEIVCAHIAVPVALAAALYAQGVALTVEEVTDGAALRDTLQPKLMNGEIDVSAVQI